VENQYKQIWKNTDLYFKLSGPSQGICVSVRILRISIMRVTILCIGIVIIICLSTSCGWCLWLVCGFRDEL
jgi:hypothetical protein